VGGASAGGSSSGGSPAGGTATGGEPDMMNQSGSSNGGSSNGGSANGGTGGTAHDGVLNPARPPGQNFDLSMFALQLPIANGDSVLQIKDLSTYTSDYFFSGPDGAMTFWCPVSGAHTMNTHYARTELRELATGGDWAITGTHRLTAQFKMLKNPSSKGTIVGQIHGNATDGTSEVLKLEWTTANKLVASVEDNDTPSKQIDHMLGSYALNSLVTYTFELVNGTLEIIVTDASGDKTFSTPYTAASWAKDKYYFKLGDYVQLEGTSTTDGGRVAFYSFKIEHAP
jgi:hypothetical protein